MHIYKQSKVKPKADCWLLLGAWCLGRKGSQESRAKSIQGRRKEKIENRKLKKKKYVYNNRQYLATPLFYLLTPFPKPGSCFFENAYYLIKN
jgi:hypothetical protein